MARKALHNTGRYGRAVVLAAILAVLLLATPVTGQYEQRGTISTSLAPTDIAYMPSPVDQFVVLDSASGKVFTLDTAGTTLKNSVPFINPRMAFNGNDGYIYVTGTQMGSDQLYVYDKDFNLQYTSPYAVTTPPALGAYYDSVLGNLAFPTYSGQVQKVYAVDGSPAGSFSGPANPRAIVAAPDITTTGARLCYILVSSGLSIYDSSTGAFRATPISGLASASALAVNTAAGFKMLIIGDGTTLRLYVPSGTQDGYTSIGTIPTVSNIKGIATGPYGIVYVTTQGSSTIFSYAYRPVVTGISPSGGPVAGGTWVDIQGNGFSYTTGAASSVKFGAQDATAVNIVDDTHISARAPAGAAGTVDITVVTPWMTSATSASDQYTYYSVPTVTSVAPGAGPLAGGTTVVITGTGFTGASGVKFGVSDATAFTVNSATNITATAPAGAAGTVDITVTTPGGTSATSAVDRFAYAAAPVVTSVAPTSGPAAGGTSVTITGTSFTGATAVMFGTSAATGYTVNSGTQITATAPAGTGTADVRVTTPGGTSSVLPADQFTYIPAPAVTGIAPASGPAAGGTSVTIAGTSFTGATAVMFGATAATGYTVNSGTQITATAPAGAAGTVDVTVTTPGGTSAAGAPDRFTYNAPVVPTPAPTAVSYGSDGGGDSDGSSGAGPAGAGSANNQQAPQQRESTPVNVGGSTPVTSATVYGSGNSDAVVTATSLDGPPAGASPPPGSSVYSYLEISPARTGTVTGAEISFAVSQSWLAEHHLAPEQVVMYHYVAGQWVSLPTTVVRSANGQVYFSATTPSFSPFAIGVAEKQVAAGTTTASREVSGTTNAGAAATPIPAPAAIATPQPTLTTPLPAPAAGEPSFPLTVIALIAIGGLVLIGGGWYIRRWWIRRQNPALFDER